MQINGTHSADVVGYSVKRNKANDGRTASLDLDIGVNADQADSRFGEDFAELAFATMRVLEAEGDDETDTVVFLQDNIKPGKRVVLEKHVITIEGHELKEIPELFNIRTVDGARMVVARLRIPVDADKGDAIGLSKMVGKTLKVEFNPQQATLAFEGQGAA